MNNQALLFAVALCGTVAATLLILPASRIVTARLGWPLTIEIGLHLREDEGS
jgi:hypothetical protein